MRLQQTNSPYIDVAPAKIDANYIAVNCSCILPKFRSNMSHTSSRITYMQVNILKFIIKQDDVRLAIAHQIKSKVAI